MLALRLYVNPGAAAAAETMAAGGGEIAEAVCSNDGTISEPVSADAAAQPRRLRVAEPVNAPPVPIAEAMDPDRPRGAEPVFAKTDCPSVPDARGVCTGGR